jgi:hypothetical protein
MVFNLTKVSWDASELSGIPFAVTLIPVIEGAPSPHPGWTITGTIQRPFLLEPTVVDFQDRLIRGEQNTPFIVTAKSAEPFAAMRTRCADKYCIVNVTKHTSRVGVFQLAIGLRPNIPFGAFAFVIDLIGIREDGTELPPIQLPVRGFAYEAIRAIPTNLPLGALQQGEDAERAIILRSTSGQPFRLIDIMGLDESIRARADKSDAKSNEDITITVRINAAKLRDVRYELVFGVQDQNDRCIQVPFSLSYFGMERSK